MAKKIEEKYQQLTEQEHVLHRPGMWIGSIKDQESSLFIYNNATEKMEVCDVTYCPGMLKLVDEVLSNSCDEYRRKDNLGLNEVSVCISKKEGWICIRDNGGIPVVKHKEAKMYVPEFIFGQLRTSSNYDDTEDRNVIGTNGVGSSLTNIFSKKFEVITCDKKNKLKVTWENNMSKKSTPKIDKSKEHYTEITFWLDFDRFDQQEKGFTEDFINILQKRCIDAAVANPGLKVVFIDETSDYSTEWKFKKFEEYMELYSDYFEKDTVITYKDTKKQFWICPDSSIDVAFVNGAECSKGTHIKAIRYPVGHAISEVLLKKHKIDVTNKAIDNKYGIFAILDISNPSYSSQTKEELTTAEENFYKDSSKFEIKDDFLKKCQKSEIVDLVVDWYKKKLIAEDEKTLRKLNRDASKGLKRSDKFLPANSKKKNERQLFIYEGDSAGRGARAARNPMIQAAYFMRGVVPNSLDMTPVQIMKNDVFNDLITILGLKFGKDFDINDLNYGKIVISTDADVDGNRIAALLLLFFSNWPELFNKKIVVRSITPIIIAKKGKESKKYYSFNDYKKDERKLNGYMIKYIKGLSGLDNEETKETMRNPIFMTFEYDSNADIMFKKWFGKDSNIRKQLMGK